MTLTVWDAPAEPIMAQPERAVVRLPSLDEVVSQWPQIESHLAKATKRTGCYEPIDLLRMAMTGAAAIWLAEVGGNIEAVLVTTLQPYPRRRVLEVLFGGGSNMRAWLKPAIETIEAHARQLGCTQIACVGRPGWARAWTGAHLTGDVIIAKDL